MSKSCCTQQTRRQGVFDYFERGLRSRRLAPLPISAPSPIQANGLWVHFSLRLEMPACGAPSIAELRFNCSVCTTLIAACQAVAEHFQGQTMAAVLVRPAQQLLPQLLNQIEGIPVAKRDRLWLALGAFFACLHSQKGQHPVEHVS